MREPRHQQQAIGKRRIPGRESTRRRPGAPAGTPVFRPASRPKVANLPSPTAKKRGTRNAGLPTGIAAGGRETPIGIIAAEVANLPSPTAKKRPGTPVFRPASRPRSRTSHRPPRRSAGPGTPVFRPASRPQVANLPSPTAKKRGTRNAGLPTGIAAGGRHRKVANHRPPRRSAGPGTPVFRPASRPEAAKLPSPGSRRSAGPGTPVFRPASRPEVANLPSPTAKKRGTRTPVFRPASRPEVANLPSPTAKKRGTRNAGLPTGIAARSRTSHRPPRRSAGPGAPVFRPASRPEVANLPSPTAKKRGTRNAGLPTGIAAEGREPPIAHREEARDQDRAGLPTGIAAGGREPPIAHREEARDQERRSSDRHRGRRPRTSHRPPRRSAGPGTPVFRPASRPEVANLPSPPAKKRGTRNAGLPTGIAAGGREPPIAPREEARDQERRSSDGHRGRRPRTSHRPPRRSAEPGTPVFRPASRPQVANLPSPTAKKRGTRSAGLPTGIAAGGREPPIAPREEARDQERRSSDRHRGRRSRTSHRPPRRSAGPGTPVFRPASRPEAANLPSPTAKKRGTRSAGLQTGIAAEGREPPIAHREEARDQERRSSDRHRGRRSRTSHRPPRRSAGPGAPVFRPASRPKVANLPSPTAKKRGTRNAGLPTGIAAGGRETPIAHREEARDQERRSSDRHRGRRPRNSHR